MSGRAIDFFQCLAGIDRILNFLKRLLVCRIWATSKTLGLNLFPDPMARSQGLNTRPDL